MRVGIDIQVVAGGNRSGLFHHLRLLAGAMRPMVDDRLWLLAEAGRTPRLGPADAAKLRNLFDGAAVRLVRPPRRFYRVWHRLSRFNRVDVLLHNLHGRLPLSTRGANAFLVPDVIPLGFDYGDPGYVAGCRAFYERAARDADVVIVSSAHGRHDFLAKVGGDPARVRVCPLAAGPEFVPTADPAALARHGLTDTPYVLYVATVEKRKNHAVLLRAFARLVAGDSGLRHRLVLVGGKWVGHEAVFDLIGTLGLSERVVYLGYAADLPALYSGADAFVFPSLYEGFGLPPLEAMACGVPVLAADATSVPEVVGDAGVLFDPHDDAALATKLRRVLTDRPYRDTLAVRGLAHAATFRWEKTAAAYLDAFRVAAGGS